MDSTQKWPAFPSRIENTINEPIEKNGVTIPPMKAVQFAGLTSRQYAALHLRVPNSGLNWLDAMIAESLRDDFAAKAMQSFMSWALDQAPFDGYDSAAKCCKAYARHSYEMADAMLEAKGK